MSMRPLGLVLLGLGFMGAAFFATETVKSVNWIYYGLSFVLGVAGVILLRVTSHSQVTSSHKLETDIQTLHTAISTVVKELSAFISDWETTDVYDVHDQIDARLMAPINDFVMAREAMIPVFGLNGYAEVMTRFATGERMINRAWSASADGYIDEVWASIELARNHLSDAQLRLSQLKQTIAV